MLLQHRGVCTAPSLRGLEEFFDRPAPDGEKVFVGRAWQARDLRIKSWDDLHKLWYVLLKERNLLLSDRDVWIRDGRKAQGQSWDKAHRLQKVKKSMCRIKGVMWERARSLDDPAETQRLKDFIDAL
ncbi:hypothetical protein WJX81_005275 [Elliptochloris bilobata]|uniref:Large ribosomal subunit protein uL29m n=1 Tax=Elliptochloris bilobata TaxID=381761 RepID=A0AAW1S221_9CHLO